MSCRTMFWQIDGDWRVFSNAFTLLADSTTYRSANSCRPSRCIFDCIDFVHALSCCSIILSIFVFSHPAFGFQLSNDVSQILQWKTLIAMATKFETK